jgi:Glycosyl transferases group 1
VAPDFFTTLHLPLRADWVRRAEMLDTRTVSHWELLRRVARAAREYEVLALNGASHREQAVVGLVAPRHRSTRFILTDCTWKRGDTVLDRLLTRAGVRAIDRGNVTYCVLSSDEERAFPHTWGVDPARVTFTPWCYTLSEQELSLAVTDDRFVFAGGDSMRNYGPLLEAARGLDFPIKIAARRAVGSDNREPPANVDVGPTTHQRFIELTAGATVVVVDLETRGDRSAGQGTYLNAMAMGKPVIVPDAMGVRDYVDPGRTGLIVPAGDAAALRSALDWVLADENRDAVRNIAARAQETVRAKFGPEQYVAALLRAVDAVAAQPATE